MLATEHGHADVATMLLQHGAEPNPQLSFGAVPPLISAYLAGSRATIEALLDHGADAIAGMRAYRSVLVVAVEDSRHDIVRCVAAHLDQAERRSAFTHAMRWAIDHHDWSMIDLLEDLGGDATTPDVLESACRRSVRAVEYIIAKGAEPSRHHAPTSPDDVDPALADCLGERASWLTRFDIEMMSHAEHTMSICYDFGRLFHLDGWSVFLVNQGHVITRTITALRDIGANIAAQYLRDMLTHCRELPDDDYGFGGGWMESEDDAERERADDIARRLIAETSHDELRRLMARYAWSNQPAFRTWVETWPDERLAALRRP